MRACAKLSVKGTKYYKAAELFQQGSLSPGVAIRLQHQPENRHDTNAVAVKIKRTGTMLGYLSRELAPKYAAILNEGNGYEASICDAEKNGSYIKINVQVVYEKPDKEVSQKHNSRLLLSASSMPIEAGIYEIKNIESGRQYIGSSTNLKDRINSHIRDLSIGRHANHALQSDFSRLGADCFEAKILMKVISPSSLAAEESNRIRLLLNSGSALYNLTEDGQGRRTSRRHAGSEPISDRFERERAEAENRQIEKYLSNKRNDVISHFDPKLAALQPQKNFFTYFLVTFIGALIVMLLVGQKIQYGSLVFSTIMAFMVSLFLRSYFQKKASQTAQYKALVRQRNEQLDEIESERREKGIRSLTGNRR